MAEAILEPFLAACRRYDGGEPGETLREASGEFMGHAKSDPALPGQAAAAMRDLPAPGAAWLAILLGALVEGGGSAEETTPALLERFRAWLSELPTADDSASGEEAGDPRFTPEQRALANAFDRLCQALVAHLARRPEQRRLLGQDLPLLNRLDELEAFSNGARWVRETLLRRSGSLIVLHPPSGNGLRLRYENVANCFHLFSLLQAAIGERLPGGRSPDPRVADAARGRSQEPMHDTAWWHYGDPRAATASLQTSVWGEGLVEEIPSINGQQVLLLWPPLIQSRGWNSGFYGPHLAAMPANVTVEAELTQEEARTWCEALGVTPDSRRKWWPFGRRSS